MSQEPSFENAFSDAVSTSSQPIPQASIPDVSVQQAPPVQETPVAPEPPPIQAPEAAPFVQTPTEPAISPELLAMAREAGLTVGIGETVNPETLARLALQNLQRVNPYVNYAQQILPHADQFQAYLQSLEQPAPQSQQQEEWTPEKYFESKWGAPKWSETAQQAIENGWVTKDPSTNAWVPAPGCEVVAATIIPEINRIQAAQQQSWKQITQGNPIQYFHDALREPMQRAWKKDIEEYIQQRFTQVATENEVNTFERDNASWLYAQNALGQRVYTPEGQRLATAIQSLEAHCPDPGTRLKLALEITGIGNRSQAPQSQPAVNSTAPLQPQAAPESFVQNAIRASHAPSAAASQMGLVPQSTSVSEGELNNMFNAHFRAQRGS